LIEIELYKWAGKWGPFKINSECDECTVAYGQLQGLAKKYSDSVSFKALPWLNNWFQVLLKGGYHPPITFVNGKLFHQHSKKNPLPDVVKIEEMLKNKFSAY